MCLHVIHPSAVLTVASVIFLVGFADAMGSMLEFHL